MQIKIDQRKLLKGLKEFPSQTFKSVSLELKKSSRDIQNLSRSNHRFTTRTGALERSVETRHIPSRLISKVGINKKFAKYGKYIHDGFKSWKPDPFITKAGESLKDDIERNINKAVSRSVKGSFRG